jgi:hypothetical protein
MFKIKSAFVPIVALLSVVALVLSSCMSASAADGFIETAKSMTDTQDSDIGIRVEIQTDSSAQKVSLGDFVRSISDKIVTADISNLSNSVVGNGAIEILMRNNAKAEFSDDIGAYIQLGWVGPAKTDTIIEVFLTKTDVFIGTSIADLVRTIVSVLGDGVGDSIAGMLDAIPQNSWIRLSFDEMRDMVRTETSPNSAQATDAALSIFDLQSVNTDTLKSVSNDFLGVIESKYSKGITKSGDTYILTLGMADFASITADMAQILTDNQAGLSDFLSALLGDETSRSLSVEEVISGIEESAAALDKAAKEKAQELKDVKFTVSLSDTGKGNSRKQKMVCELVVPEEAVPAALNSTDTEYEAQDLPDTLRASVAFVVSAQNLSAQISGASVLSVAELTELVGSYQMSLPEFEDPYVDYDGFSDFGDDDSSGDLGTIGGDFDSGADDEDDWVIIGGDFDSSDNNDIGDDWSVSDPDALYNSWLLESVNVGDTKEEIEAVLEYGKGVSENIFQYKNGAIEVYYNDGIAASITMSISNKIDSFRDPSILDSSVSTLMQRIESGEELSYDEVCSVFGVAGSCYEKYETRNAYIWVDGNGSYISIVFNIDGISLEASGTIMD